MTDLYDIDTVAWSAQQAALLRRVAAGERPNTAPDWSNIAEEIESMGKAQARELASRVAVVLVHLIKLQASPATEPRAGWIATILRERADIDLLLEESPSLRSRLTGIVPRALTRARADAAASLAANGETPRQPIDGLAYTDEQVLGNWLP